MTDGQVVISDFPDPALVNNLAKNVERNVEGREGVAETKALVSCFLALRLFPTTTRRDPTHPLRTPGLHLGILPLSSLRGYQLPLPRRSRTTPEIRPHPPLRPSLQPLTTSRPFGFLPLPALHHSSFSLSFSLSLAFLLPTAARDRPLRGNSDYPSSSMLLLSSSTDQTACRGGFGDFERGGEKGLESEEGLEG